MVLITLSANMQGHGLWTKLIRKKVIVKTFTKFKKNPLPFRKLTAFICQWKTKFYSAEASHSFIEDSSNTLFRDIYGFTEEIENAPQKFSEAEHRSKICMCSDNFEEEVENERVT